LCETIAASGGMLCPHPETIEIAWVLRDRMQALDPQGEGGLATWNGTRPPLVEAEAVQRAACIAQSVGAPVYFVHTSSRAALEAALRFRGDGRSVHIETCPHYLTHDQSWEGGELGKVNPPLREAADREALWRALLAGDIDTFASDHVHRDVSCKQGGIWNASPGCPGLETLLPVLLSEGHHKRGMTLERIADVIATAPARLMGMGGRKGAIAVGSDADLTFVDPDATWWLERSDVVSSAGFSIYEGWEFRGAVVHAMSRGRFVLRESELQNEAVGHGRFVQRRL
jgi:dihydroorotase-like cyclic amidohydrolase